MSVVDVRGAPTLVGRQLNRDLFRGTGVLTHPFYFKIGEGGYAAAAGGALVPVDPDDSGQGYSTRTDIVATIDIDVDPSNTGLRFKKKLLGPTDLTAGGLTDLLIRCYLDLTEGNYNPRKPKYFEVGVFDANNVMLIYGTFPEEEKDNTRTLLKQVKITF